ncbi:MAG: hypothetical protein KDA59_15790, partial [Planctomycetales bacterium]|nr:hypothetical protein [Planctomycetales bacterium]
MNRNGFPCELPSPVSILPPDESMRSFPSRTENLPLFVRRRRFSFARQLAIPFTRAGVLRD